MASDVEMGTIIRDPTPAPHVTINVHQSQATQPLSIMSKLQIIRAIPRAIMLSFIPKAPHFISKGVLTCAPAAVTGHILLRYALWHPSSDAYRIATLLSSVVSGVIGGAILGLVKGMSSIVAGACIVLYGHFCQSPQLRRESGASDHGHGGESALFASRWWYLWIFFWQAMTPLFAVYLGANVIWLVGFDIKTLDPEHALIAAMVGNTVVNGLAGVMLLLKARAGASDQVGLQDSFEAASQDAEANAVENV